MTLVFQFPPSYWTKKYWPFVRSSNKNKNREQCAEMFIFNNLITISKVLKYNIHTIKSQSNICKKFLSIPLFVKDGSLNNCITVIFCCLANIADTILLDFL